jgi:Putative  PD-(D/E)XK family member, (DUF4420)
MSLFRRFAALPRPPVPGVYSCDVGTERFRVARSYDNHPAVLIEFADGGGTSTPRRLDIVSYSPPSPVDFTNSGGNHYSTRLAILECRTSDSTLGAYFFRIVAPLLLDNLETVDESGFEKGLDALVTLFRSLQRPGARTVQGLWAELAMVAWSANPAAALSSWHSSPRALHDFSAGIFRLEVKGTMRELREHTFALDQLSSLTQGETLIASLLLRESEDGATVFDLIESIERRVGSLHGPAARLETIVAESLGSSWREAAEMRFSLDDARRDLLLYKAEDIPTVPQPLPPAVKDVRFVVDLSAVPDVDLRDARALGAALADILPADTTAI